MKMNRRLLFALLVTFTVVSVTFSVPSGVRYGDDDDDDDDNDRTDVIGVVEETEDEAEKEAEEEVEEKLESLEGPSRARRSLREMISGDDMHLRLVRRARATVADLANAAFNGFSLQ